MIWLEREQKKIVVTAVRMDLTRFVFNSVGFAPARMNGNISSSDHDVFGEAGASPVLLHSYKSKLVLFKSMGSIKLSEM